MRFLRNVLIAVLLSALGVLVLHLAAGEQLRAWSADAIKSQPLFQLALKIVPSSSRDWLQQRAPEVLAFVVLLAPVYWLTSLSIWRSLRNRLAPPRPTFFSADAGVDHLASIVPHVDFYGRTQELSALTAFVHAPERAAWWCMIGRGGMGKTRIAKHFIQSLSRSRWDAGFVNWDGLEQIKALPALRRDTLLVLDEASQYRDRPLWQMLAQLLKQDKGKKLRILLIEWQAMSPPENEASEFIRAIDACRYAAREDQPEVSAPVPKGAMGDAAGAPSVTVATVTGSGTIARVSGAAGADQGDGARPPMPPLEIQPIRALAELKAIATSSARRKLSEEEMGRIIADAEGSPLLVAMIASKKRPGRQNPISTIAAKLIRESQKDFDGPDGPRMLTLAALAGPVSSEQRMAIAPKAGDRRKLRAYFSESHEATEDTLPRLQPELLAQEVVLQYLSSLQKSDRIDLVRKCVDANRGAAERRIQNIWIQRPEAHAVYLINNGVDCGPQEDADAGRQQAVRDITAALEIKGVEDLFTPRECVGLAAAALSSQAGLANGELSARAVEHLQEQLDKSDPLIAEIVRPLVARLNAGAHRMAIARIAVTLIDVGPFKHLRYPYAFQIEAGGGIPAETQAALARELASGDDGRACAAAVEIGEAAFAAFQREPDAAGREQMRSLASAMLQASSNPSSATVRGSAFALVHLLKATGAVDPLYNPDPALHFPMVDALASEPHFVYATRMARVLGKAYAPRLDPAIELASWAGGDAEGAKASPAPSGVIDAISALFARADLDTDSNEAFQAAMALLRAGVLSDASAPLIIDAALGRRGTNVRAEIMARLPLAKGERTIAALRSIAEQADRITRPAARAALLRLGAEDPFAEDGAITKEQLSALALRDLGHLVHKLKAKDTTGRWAYYFVLVQATREEAFLAAIKDKGTIDLEDYGKVVASCYGEQPTQEIKDYLSERYGWNV